MVTFQIILTLTLVYLKGRCWNPSRSRHTQLPLVTLSVSMESVIISMPMTVNFMRHSIHAILMIWTTHWKRYLAVLVKSGHGWQWTIWNLMMPKQIFFLWLGHHNIKQLCLDKIELTIGTSTIKPSKVIRNLGVYFDNTMTLSSHIDNVRRSVLFHIRNLWRIRKFIDTETCHHDSRALVLSRIDYCNALFTCLSAKNTSRLQRLQNSGARVVFAVSRRTEAGFLYLRELLLRSCPT